MLPLRASVGYRPPERMSAVPALRFNVAPPSPNTPRPAPRLHNRAPSTPCRVILFRRQRADARASEYTVSPTNDRSIEMNIVFSPRSNQKPDATTPAGRLRRRNAVLPIVTPSHPP